MPIFQILVSGSQDYQFVSRNFIDNKIFVYDNQSLTVKVNSIRAIVAENLVRKLPWWCDLWETLSQTEPLESEDLDKQIVFNRRGLLAMLEQDTKLQIYQNFIRAFHEALRKIYAKIYDRKRSRAENNQRIDKKYQEDIDPNELWIGGKITKNLELNQAHIFPGRKKTVAELKKVIARNLNLNSPQP